MSPPTS
ncbi:hypothetical protein Egran_05922 [Elaphomyces granulatus]|nr:hypothetical protein Egran_05922 [Elaphomyces granulatus]